MDIYALLRFMPLAAMLISCKKKFRLSDAGAMLMGLAYFNDAEKERMPDMLWDISWREMKRAIAKEVKAVSGAEKKQER